MKNNIIVKEIIENHQHYLNKDCENWENMKADLAHVNLAGMNLDNVNLSEAILTEANLSGATLRFANLKKADLSNAELAGAILAKADLTGANLSGADLSGANLFNTILLNANLFNTNVSKESLSNATISEIDIPLEKGYIKNYIEKIEKMEKELKEMQKNQGTIKLIYEYLIKGTGWGLYKTRAAIGGSWVKLFTADDLRKNFCFKGDEIIEMLLSAGIIKKVRKIENTWLYCRGNDNDIDEYFILMSYEEEKKIKNNIL